MKLQISKDLKYEDSWFEKSHFDYYNHAECMNGRALWKEFSVLAKTIRKSLFTSEKEWKQNIRFYHIPIYNAWKG